MGQIKKTLLDSRFKSKYIINDIECKLSKHLTYISKIIYLYIKIYKKKKEINEINKKKKINIKK